MQVLGGILLAIVIAITNGAYRLLAVRLNEWENHRTATAYEDALIVKTFTFQATPAARTPPEPMPPLRPLRSSSSGLHLAGDQQLL